MTGRQWAVLLVPVLVVAATAPPGTGRGPIAAARVEGAKAETTADHDRTPAPPCPCAPVRRSERVSFEDVRASLWFAPSVSALVALAAALALAEVVPSDRTWLGRLPWPGDYDTASTVLQVISTATITVTSLTFSLVVVALQLASQQFSPRLLREFARDWVIQLVLSVLVATFVFSLTVLLALRAEEPLPKIAVLLAYLLGLLSIAGLLAFLGHLVRALRIDTMMVAVHGETVATMEQTYPSLDEPEPRRPDGLPDAPGGTCLPAPRSGFVKVVDPRTLVQLASRTDTLIELLVRPGDHLVVGTPIGTARRPDGSEVPELAEELAEGALAAIELGYERTSEQDTALGLRQLTDIAVKALSPGINDPVTAVHAIGYSTDLLVRLHGKQLGPQVHCDERGQPRVVLPDRDHRYYLDLACGQIRRYGRREPTVLVALLRLLRDVALSVHGEQQAEDVRRQVRLVLAEMADDLLPEDVEQVADAARRVEQALAGQVSEAFTDRAGETRSL